MQESTNIIARIFQNRIAVHALFWLSTLIIFPIYGMSFGLPFLAGLIIKGFLLPIQILATYLLIHYQIPKFLYQKKYLRFALFFFLSVLLFCTLGHLSDDLFIKPKLSGYGHASHTILQILANPFANVGYNASDIYLTVFLAAGLKFMKDRMEEKTQLDILEQEKANAEINLLKAQINPRILSKTLHQLHTLTKEKSDAAPEVVIKLSEMLDYMLYQCNSPKVLVNDEITLIQNYLDLEKLRHGDNLQITFYHHLENKKIDITPLLLLSLVEAVFTKKEEQLPTNAKVEIILKEKKENLSLQITSNLVTQKTVFTTDAKKQLDLLYPNQHELITTSKGDVFNLSLKLKQHPILESN